MLREVIIFTLSLILLGVSDFVNSGYLSYKKPPKYWYYKQQPQLFMYPKLKYHTNDALNAIHLYGLGALYKNPLKYTKYIRPVDKLKAGLVLGDHILLTGDKNYGVNGWLTDGEHVKFSKPVFGFGSPAHYYTGDQLHQHQHTDSDIKPVMEHIENDLKYDFRTKTHSYR